MRSSYTTLITSLFLPTNEPEPHDVPLPNAPHANPDITLPTGGVNLLFGQSAPRLLSVAMHEANAIGYRPYNATITADFQQPIAQRVDLDNLAQTPALVLMRSRIGRALAEAIHEQLLAYLTAEGIKPTTKYTPTAFELVSGFPDLLQRLLEEKPYKHLVGLCYSIPSVGLGPPSQMFYLRDLSTIKRIQTASSSQEQTMFRLPNKKELQSPPTTFNPFLDKPSSSTVNRSTKAKRPAHSPSA